MKKTNPILLFFHPLNRKFSFLLFSFLEYWIWCERFSIFLSLLCWGFVGSLKVWILFVVCWENLTKLSFNDQPIIQQLSSLLSLLFSSCPQVSFIRFDRESFPMFRCYFPAFSLRQGGSHEEQFSNRYGFLL
jgi:hypothetical protein